MTIETVPGVILIGKEDPAGIINQPLIDLFQALGIERDEEEDDGWDDMPAEEKMHQDQEGRFMLRLHR